MPTKKMSRGQQLGRGQFRCLLARGPDDADGRAGAALSQPSGSPGAYQFASRCKKIHGFFDLTGQYHIAYLCETNLYVDTGQDASRHFFHASFGRARHLIGGRLWRRPFTSRNVLLNAASAWTTTSTTITMPAQSRLNRRWATGLRRHQSAQAVRRRSRRRCWR